MADNGQEDFAILPEGHPLVMHLMTRRPPKEENISMSCTQLCSAVTGLIQWNPVIFEDQEEYRGYVIFRNYTKDDKRLTTFLQKCIINQCIGCVLVNPDEGSEIIVSTIDFNQYSFPIYVLNKNNGAHLQELMKHDVFLKTVEESNQSFSLYKRVKRIINKRKQIPVQLRKYFHENWKEEIEIDHAVDVFIQCILFFQRLDEEALKQNVIHDMSEINEHIFSAGLMSVTFPVMFPIYIFYTVHVANNTSTYFSDDQQMCIEVVIFQFHELLKSRSKDILCILQKFRPERLNDQLKPRWKNLATSFLSLLELWVSMHSQEIPQNFFAIAIPIIIIAQVIMKECGVGKSEIQKLWSMYLLKYADRISFGQKGSLAVSHIHGLREGMQFQVTNRIPPECYFTPRNFKDLLCPAGTFVSLLEARNALLTLPKYLQCEWQTSFVSDFVMPLRIVYHDVLKKRRYLYFTGICSLGDWTGMITEGIGLVTQIEKFVETNECKETFVEKSFKWLQMLAKCVQFDKVIHITQLSCIDAFFDENKAVVNNLERIRQKLCSQLKKKLNRLSPEQFLTIESYTRKKGISDDSLFQEFFRATEIQTHANQGDVICSKTGYFDLIEEWISRNSTKIMPPLIDFFDSVHQYYLSDERPSDLFLDLIQLNVHGFLPSHTSTETSQPINSEEKAFTDFLRKKMTNAIAKTIFEQLIIYMKLPLRSTKSNFQVLVCKVILEGLKTIELSKDKENFYNGILSYCQHVLMGDTRALLSDLNCPQIRFICGIIHMFASKVKFKTHSWISTSPVSIFNLLNTLLPLYSLPDGGIPTTCHEILCCLKFFNDVRKKVESIGDTLNDQSISFNQLNDFKDSNSFLEITRIIEIVKPEKESIDIEKVDRIFKKFTEVRACITGILVPSFHAKNIFHYDSLFHILQKYDIQLPKDIYDKLSGIVDLSHIDIFVSESHGTENKVQLPFCGTRNIVETEELLNKLRNFLGSLCDKLHIFCFLNQFKCSFFENLVQSKLLAQLNGSKDPVVRVESLSEGCNEAMIVIQKVVSGRATLNELGLKLIEETGRTISLFEFFTLQLDSGFECQGYNGFNALLSLNDIYKVMLVIEELCSQCKLEICMNDTRFRKLSAYSNQLSTPEYVPLQFAICMEKEFIDGLPNVNGKFDVYFKLFSELKECFSYVKFLRSKGFIGEEGKRKFSQERNLITQEIQHTLEQRILDDLWDAYSTLSYFLDTTITYDAWKSGLQNLSNVQNCVIQIQVLHKHSMMQLESIFALKEGESKESTWKQLNVLFEDGVAVYSADNDSPVTLIVQFRNQKEKIKEEWDLKALSEFATAAELMQINEEDQDNEQDIDDIKFFLQIYENCLAIVDILGKLKDAGHFEYLELKNLSHTFHRHSMQWKTMLEKLKGSFHKWEVETPERRKKYTLLSFFSNRKIYQIGKLVKTSPCNTLDLERLIRTNMLFAHSPQHKIQQEPTYQISEHYLKSIKVCVDDPFTVAGQIITVVWEDFKRHNIGFDEPHMSLRNESNFFRLYHLSDCTNLKLYTTTLNLLHAPLTPFQVLPCTAITTQEAITLFFQRVRFRSCFRYVLIDVNVLPLDLQEVVIKECGELLEHGNSAHILYDITFIESIPSLMRTMPWCFQDNMSLENDTGLVEKFGHSDLISCEVVYGHAGNGKSYYIRSAMNQLKCPMIVFPINEGFDVQSCIKELNTVSQADSACALHLNFTLPFLRTYAITEEEKRDFQMVCKLVNWFFFSLMLSGYVEDYRSGKSFSVVQLKKINVFVEVPVLCCSSNEQAYIDEFFVHFPIFSFIATSTICINSETMEFNVTSADAMLVCKYFEARKIDQLDILYKVPTGIKKLFFPSITMDGVRIGNYPVLNKDKSYSLLQEVFKKHSIKDRKVYQKMFVRYMYRRCKFMEESFQMRFFDGRIPSTNEKGEFVELDGRRLRSSLLYLMESEASEMCLTEIGYGFNPPHIQLVYDEGSFGILTRGGPAHISSEKMDIISRHGFKVPGPRELKEQSVLEDYLCRALQIHHTPGGGIPVLRSIGYVLTLDYLLKMISIHERQQCGMPVIISGETGVGKTFLLKTLSFLYNFSHKQQLDRWRSTLFNFLKIKIHVYSQAEEDVCLAISSLDLHSRNQFLKDVHEWFQKMEKDNDILKLFSMINFCSVKREIPKDFDDEICKELLLVFLFGERRQLFKVFQIHTGLTPSDIRKFLKPIIEEENSLGVTNKGRPKVTIFFDEVNTSSCLGFLKEVIVDHSIDGKTLPENIFIVAACNPHRGNSISTIVKNTGTCTNEKWFKGDYLVRPLHPSFDLLVWDFGFLELNQEIEYIESKLKLLETTLTNPECNMLIEKIAGSQHLLRQFTQEYLLECNVIGAEAVAASSSVVSQRDIQRVLKIYVWLKESFKDLNKYGYTDESEFLPQSNWQISVRALYLSLALVYYFRLNEKYRDTYAKHLNSKPTPVVETSVGKRVVSLTFTKVLTDELNWLMENIDLPPGVADTKAQRENLFSIIVCVMTKIPLIIIGPPGSSKTLSFKIAVANLLGEVSKKTVFRHRVMKYVEPYIYQCSKHSVSDDIRSLFNKATLRQKQIDKGEKNANVVIFMDEAGLPEEKLQVLKVLHYLLDDPQVSFVALSNTILDAAKSNRAICLFQVHSSHEDLQHLAGTMLGFSSKESIPEAIMGQITCLTLVYFEKMAQEDFSSIFGLRDMMHFFSYIRRKLSKDDFFIPPEIILRSLQRNFSGGLDFQPLAEDFLVKCGLHLNQISAQGMMSPLLVFQDSLEDNPKDLSYENEVRYKLLIDHIEDGSIVQLLFKFHVLERKATRIHCLSTFLSDRLQKATTVAKIKNSIFNGHTVILIQCDDIFESFYDLFNQRFTFIDDDRKQVREYYARIASGSKSANCLVHSNFQCIVLVKLSEVQNIPSPFMNRFEKYRVSHDSFLSKVKNKNNLMLMLLNQAEQKVDQFLNEVPPPGIYGLEDQTLSSLMIAHINVKQEDNNTLVDCIKISPGGDPVFIALKKYLISSSSKIRSVQPTTVSAEINEDINYVLGTIMKDELALSSELISKVTQLETSEFSQLDDDEDILKFMWFTTQLLCVRMIKELLQLMPPEVFLAMKEKISNHYVRAYLNHHYHFNLEEVMKDSIKKSRENGTSAVNKILCFSRTTSFVFENLPHEFFDYDSDAAKFEKQKKLKIVFPHLAEDDIASLCVLQVLHNSVGSDIARKIRNFLLFDCYGVMLLLVNMQDVSKETVHYLRVLIEEAEFEIKEKKRFIILLHFPSENFFIHCYPSYFLDGWDFCYLDAVAPTVQKDIIDLKSCFLYAYSNESSSDMKFVEEVVDSLLSTEIAAFSAAHIGTMLPNKLLALLSFESKDRQHSIGKALKSKFCKQWTPTRMMQTLQQAANSALSLDYTLNMTDAINTIIKSNFLNFMHYMLTLIAKHGALSILLTEGSSHFLNLICSQIETIALPISSTEMKIQGSINNEAVDIPIHFPFFHTVYHAIDDILKNLTSELSSSVTEENIDNFKSKIETQSFISATVEQMDNDPKLWTSYMLQFLSLYHNGVNENSELLKYFYDQSNSLGIYGKLVWLHCSFSLIPHDIISLLKFLDTLSADSDDSKPFTEKCVLELLAYPKQCAEELIKRFHNVLTIFAEDSSEKTLEAKIRQLLPKYRDVFLCSPLKELIYMNLTPEIEVIRDGIAVFFTLISTDATFNRALELLKHFTNYSLRFTEILKYRIWYLVKLPVEKLTNFPFLMLFSEKSIDTSIRSSIRNFVHQILKLVVDYSSVEQKEQLIDWICGGVCIHEHLRTISLKKCEEAESVSSLCFVERLFDIAIGCDEHYLENKVECLSRNPVTYLPYYLKHLSKEYCGDQATLNLEPLKTLLFLREIKLLTKHYNGIGYLLSQYNEHKEGKSLWSSVKKEAIVSLIVEETAKNIVNRSDTLIIEVDNILKERNHGLFLVFRIFQNCKSFRELRKVVLHENELCKNFSCLIKIRQTYSLEKAPVFPETTPSSLIDSIQNKEMMHTAKHIFLKVCSAVKEMVSSSKQEIPRSLIEIMTNSFIKSTHNLKHSTKHLFTISLFLSLYHHVYLEEIQSIEIADILKLKVNAYITQNYTHIMSIFICGGRRISNTALGINRLFTSFSNPRAQTDDFKDMWKCAANLIACILGTCQRSSNFWVHLFCPRSLDGTYIPGSMTKGPVGKQEKLYNNAMQLSDYGYCKTHKSFVYVTRGKASLACMYFIQWANFTCLCVHLLGLNLLKRESPFNGELFLDLTSACSTCLESMETLWNFFLLNLGITTEQRMILIIGCIRRLFETMNSSEPLKEPCFMTQECLDEYEKYINDNVFIPAWNDMLKQTAEYQQQIREGSIDDQILQLYGKYPVFADERSFLMLVMTSTKFCDPSGPFYVLYQFLLKRPIVDFGIRILPEMVDFYQWIHKQFPYCLTRKETDTITISQLLENEKGYYVGSNREDYRSRKEQFMRLCAYTHTFQERFDLPSDLPTLTDGMILNEIISTAGFSGLILKWIDCLITKNNYFLDDICHSTYGVKNYYLQKIVNDYNEVSAFEVKPISQDPVSWFGDIAEMMPFVERCCCLSPGCFTSTFEDDDSLLKKVVPQVYHLKQLQDDLVSALLARLRRIKPVKSIATTFTFKNVHESVTAIFVDSAAVSLSDLENIIPLDYKVQPDVKYLALALRHCHSLSYFSLVDLTIGLRIAAKYIIQVCQCDKIRSQAKEKVMTTTLPDFLKKHVICDDNISTTKVFKDVLGIDVTRLNQLQYMFLHDMLMRDIMKALHTFVMWLEDGLYDFSSFPLVLKEDLDNLHEQSLTKIRDEAIMKGEEHQLLETIRVITHLLASCEKVVREIVEPTAASKPLKEVLPQPVKLNKRDFKHFPDVRICQYVRYRLALRRMQNFMLKIFQERVPGSYGLDSTWDDRIHMDKFLAEFGIKVTHKPEIIFPSTDIKLCDLTCEQVVQFIRSSNIGEEYALSASDSEIDGDSILTVKDKLLRKAMGMSKEPVLYLQFKFMIRRKYGERNVSKLALKFTPQKTAEFCAQFDSLKSAVPFILKHSIDGEMLLEADDDVLKQISTDFEAAKHIIKKHLY